MPSVPRRCTLPALIVSLAAMLPAADDSFAGKWNLNPAKSRLTGQTDSVRLIKPNQYEFKYGTLTWTLTLDGSEQPLPWGGMTSVTVLAAGTWKFTNMVNGKIISVDHWWLSPNGKSMLRASEGTYEDGSVFRNETEYGRTAGESTFEGNWRSRKITARTPDALIIEANGDDGFTRIVPAEKSTVSVKFDNKDCPVHGPTVPAGLTLAAERDGHHKLLTTTKMNGTLINTAIMTTDGKTMTIMRYDASVPEPYELVYDRR